MDWNSTTGDSVSISWRTEKILITSIMTVRTISILVLQLVFECKCVTLDKYNQLLANSK